MRPRDMGESGWGARVGDHITLGTGIDGIANPPGTRETPTHHTQQTPWTKYKILFLLLFKTIKRDLDDDHRRRSRDLSASSPHCHCTWGVVALGPPSFLDGS